MKLASCAAAACMALALSAAPHLHAGQHTHAGQRTLQNDPRAAKAAVIDALPPQRCGGLADAGVFARTELFFGLSRPGGVISDAEFKAFVDDAVTLRFPDGLTLLTGVGQFRDASGATIVEGSKLLILLYPRRDREADAKIEQIRTDYKVAFEQQSVLRADDVSCVSF